MRGPRWRARSTAPSTWRPRSRCAATRWPAAGRGAGGRCRVTTCAIGAAALAVAALAIAGVAAGVGHVEAYPRLDVALGPGELALASALVLAGAAPLVGRSARLGVARA